MLDTNNPAYVLFAHNGPFNPSFMRESVRTMFRTLPIDPAEPPHWQDRRMHAALLSLSALHPRDEIEIMLGVQAIAAYQAAAACFRLGMNIRRPNGDSTRHITAACSAARTFDTLLKAIERRQAKSKTRPEPQNWDTAPNPGQIIRTLEDSVRETPPAPDPAKDAVWTPRDIEITEALIERERIAKENEGLDIENTEGILPGGGMILPEDPTENQKAYMGRRLMLMYQREIEENRRNGITKLPKIRGIRPGDLIP